MLHPIRLVLPVSASDISLLEPWCNVFRALGGSPNHPVDIFATPTVYAKAVEAGKALRDFCSVVQVHQMSKDFKGGWPKACNEHYDGVIRMLTQMGNGLPWLWCELDTVPQERGWLDALAQEYVLSGNSGAMGVIMPTSKILKDGKGAPYLHLDEGDPYMVGVGIYPPNYSKQCDGLHRQLHSGPFDVFLRHYTKRSWKSTTKITTLSGTINYREENGQLVCDDAPNKPAFTSRAGAVPHGTLLHHGCKDDSLFRLVLEKHNAPYQTLHEMLMNIAPAPKPVVQDIPKPPVAAPVATTAVVKSDPFLAAALAHQNAISPPKGQTTKPESDYKLPSVEAFKEKIASYPKPQRLHVYARDLGTTTKVLQEIAKPGTGIHIAKAGWVKLA